VPTLALIENSVGPLPYKLLDFDQHSYEAEDCFTRYMPKAKLDTAIYPIQSKSGRKILLANDRVVTALEANLDQAYVPGSLVEMLKARASGDASDADRFYEPMQTEYLDHDARLKQLGEQQIEHSIMYPGGWALMAEAYLDGIDPLYDNIESFNRWIAEDWGFAYQNTIFAPAMMSLRDLDRACKELDRVLDAGARFIMLPPGPAYGRSPGDPYFDPFWCGGLVSHFRVPLPGERRLTVGLGPRAALPVLGVAVAEHLRRAADHRHPVGVDLRQPLRAIPQHPGSGE
jgi:hypothetical protein